MAMFVLVFDTSLMNVSISAVVEDLDTTVSSIQATIALEALVSAAFILIGSKVGDLIGRKRAYVLGLCGYAIGALAMMLAQSVAAMVVFWALIGGLGASLLMPAMQSLIHGNFEGAAQKKVYALVGASAAVAAAIGPLLGGFITTYLSWRVGFLLELLVIAVVLSGVGRVKDVPYTGSREVDSDRRRPLRPRHGRRRPRHPRVAGGRRRRGRAPDRRGGGPGVARLVARATQARGEADPARPRPVPNEDVPLRDLGADAPEHRIGRGDDRAADLPADGARVRRDADGSHPRAALAHDVRGRDARREEGRTAASEHAHPLGVRAAVARDGAADPGRARAPTRAGTSSSRCWSREQGSACSCPSSTTTRCHRSPRNGSARPPA